MTWLPDAAVDRLRDVADFPVPPTDRYDILEPIARGGMGTVYRALDRDLDRIVAVKVLTATVEARSIVERMRQEARILARLEHPGIVPVYDVGTLADGRLFYVMKLVDGPRLDQHAAARPLTERLRLFIRICEPVAFAHARGIIHRDLKPENVMVGPFGEVLVLDWGAARISDSRIQNADCIEDLADGAIEDCATLMGSGSPASDSSAPATGVTSIIGTRGYMPPEQARGGDVDARADVYALGGVLHVLLTGGPPDGPPFRGPRALQAIAARARAENVQDRYADVASLSNDVERYLAGEPVSALPENSFDRLARFTRRNRVAIAIVVAYLTLRYVIAWMGG